MTNPTQHGQVPEALIDLIDAYAETRHRCGGVYNAKTEAARKAVIEALSEVQALSAGPGVTSEQRRLIGVIADKIEDGTLFQSGIYPKKDLARFVRNMLDTTPTAPAEQQAAPKTAPGEPSDYQIRAITTAYEQGVGKGHQAYNSGKEIANPYSPAYRCDLAWQYGYKEGKEQAQREAKAAPHQEAQEPAAFIHWPINGPPRLVWYSQKALNDAILKTHEDGYKPDVKLYTAPQPAPAPLSDEAKDAMRWRETLMHIGAANHLGGQHFTLNTLRISDQMFLLRGSASQHFTKCIDESIARRAALAAQGGK